MRRVIHIYHYSKFKNFLAGLLFAGIAMTALAFCISALNNNAISRPEAVLPFTIAVISILMGIKTMFGQKDFTDSTI